MQMSINQNNNSNIINETNLNTNHNSNMGMSRAMVAQNPNVMTMREQMNAIQNTTNSR